MPIFLILYHSIRMIYFLLNSMFTGIDKESSEYHLKDHLKFLVVGNG